jgi:hypothetical protein
VQPTRIGQRPQRRTSQRQTRLPQPLELEVEGDETLVRPTTIAVLTAVLRPEASQSNPSHPSTRAKCVSTTSTRTSRRSVLKLEI